MPSNFSRNSLKISDVYEKFDKEMWIVDNTYQRRKVWGIKDNIRLMETILLELVIPEIFIWDCDTNPDTGKTTTHIVDGQQRINAIFEFISDKFALQKRYLLDNTAMESYENKIFSELDDEVKKKIWKYELSIVNLNSGFTIEQIRNMFYRLNLTDYSLNEQEKRNSLDSAFGKVAEDLANLEFWAEKKVFSPLDIRRMHDVEYCSNILILSREGIIDQTKSDKLNQIYSDFVDNYPDAEKDSKKIMVAIDLINKLCSEETANFTNKKTQMYTLFSLAFDFIDNDISILESSIEYFKQFVKSYNAFKNGFDLEFDLDSNKKAFEMINKYKLASSEGVNKLNNRMLRFEILKKILLDKENITIEDLKAIETKCIEYNE